MLIDPDGREIVDGNGHAVTISSPVKQKDGSYTTAFKFAKGTSDYVKKTFMNNGGRAIKAAIQVQTGREQVAKAQASKDKITITILPVVKTESIEGGESTLFGATQPGLPKEEGQEGENITVFILEGSINLKLDSEFKGVEKNNYEVVNIVYHTKKEKNVDLTYQYKDAPIKTYTENETVPTNPFPSGYSGSSTYTVTTGDDMTSSKSKWNNADGQTVGFNLSQYIDPALQIPWDASGGRGKDAVEHTGYSTTYKASSKPMSYRVPKGLFGRLKYKKKAKIKDNPNHRTVHRSWP